MSTPADSPPAKLSTRERIVAAAVAEFTRRGFAATTTRDVAAAAGVNVATLHYHHGSKEELFATVAGRAMERFNAVFEEVMERNGHAVRAFVADFVDAYTELLLEYPYLAGFIQHESERAPERFACHADFAAWAQRIAEMIGREDNLRVEAEFAARHLICSLVGALVYPFLFRATTMHEWSIGQDEFAEFVRERKRVIGEMVGRWLFVG